MKIYMISKSYRFKKPIIISIAVSILLFCCIIAPIVSALDGVSDSGSRSTSSNDTWASTKIWADDEQLEDVAVGDIDPTNEGNEVVVGGDSQRITMLTGEEYYWRSKTIWYDDWDTNAVEIGDIDARNDLDEVVVVGWSGRVTMVYWHEQKWHSQELGRRMDYLYDVAIGDLNRTNPGNELVVVGDDGEVSIFENKSGGNNDWSETIIFQDSDYLHTVAIGDINLTYAGVEILVAGGSNRLTMLYFTNGSWSSKSIWVDENTINSIAIGDFYSGHDGNEIVTVGASNNAVMHYKNAINWVHEPIWEDTHDLYNVKIGDIDPTRAGNEVITSGLSNRLIVLKESTTRNSDNSKSNSNWDAIVLLTPGEENVYLLAIALGDFDPSHNADEIVTIGYLGKVIKTQFEEHDFTVFTTLEKQVVITGRFVEFQFILTPHGGFTENIQMTLSDELLPSGIGYLFDKEVITPPGIVKLKLTTSGSTAAGFYNFTVFSTAPTAGIVHRINLTLQVRPSDQRDYEISAKPVSQSVVADYSTEFVIEVSSINNYDSSIELHISRLPTGVAASFNQTTLVPPGSVNLTLQTSTITPNRTYYLPITALGADAGGAGSGDIEHCIVLILDVGAAGLPDFMLYATPPTQTVTINQTTQYNLEVISIFGFKSAVNLAVEDVPTGVTATFSHNSVIPTSNVTLELEITHLTGFGNYDLKIVGYFSNFNHSIIIGLNVIPEPFDFILIATPEGLTVNVSETAEFKIEIVPIGNLSNMISLTVSGLPPELSWNEDISPVYVFSITELTIRLESDPATDPRTYNLTFTAQSDNGLIHNATVELSIKPVAQIQDDTEDADYRYMYFRIVILILILISGIALYLKYKKKGEKK